MSEFLVANNKSIIEFHREIAKFFDENQEEYFIPHELSYEGFVKELLKNYKDYYVFIRSYGDIIAYGMLRGWTEGWTMPSLGIMVDKNNRKSWVARAMMDHLHMVAASRAARKVRLTVFKYNLPAVNLFKSYDYILTDDINPLKYLGIKKLK